MALTETEQNYQAEYGVRFPVFLTQEEYERLPSDDGFIDELVDGELIVSPSPTIGHAYLIGQILRALLPLEQFGFSVLSKPGVKLRAGRSKTGRSSTLEPDVAVFEKGRLLKEMAEGMYAEHLLLAVEVVSPSNTKRELEKKIQAYLQLGAYEVWVVDQNAGVRVVQKSGVAEYLERGVTGTPDPLPRVDVDFDQIFSFQQRSS